MTTARRSLAGLLAPIIVLFACTAWAQDLELVSRQDAADGGVQGNLDSRNPSISADGRFVAFDSSATNLIPGGGPDANGTFADVFVFDRTTGSLELVSLQGGAQGNFGNSLRPSISADGRFVAFASGHVFVFDRTTGALELVSRQDVADGGAPAGGAQIPRAIIPRSAPTDASSPSTQLRPT